MNVYEVSEIVTVFLPLVPKIKISNITVFENDGRVGIQVERSEGLHRSIVMDVASVDGTASG